MRFRIAQDSTGEPMYRRPSLSIAVICLAALACVPWSFWPEMFSKSDAPKSLAPRLMRDDVIQVRLCKEHLCGSLAWLTAFRRLAHCDKDTVIDYVRQCLADPQPHVRYWCYDLAKEAGWHDLRSQAYVDLFDKTLIFGVCNIDPAISTIGDCAASYLAHCDSQDCTSVVSDK
jgi:hypothetical protein